MKKILCLFLLLTVVLYFSACCSSEDSDENTTNNNTTDGDTTGNDTNSDELKLEGYVLSTITGSVDVESILTRSDIISRTDLIHRSDLVQTVGITSPVGVPVDTMKKKNFRYKSKTEVSDDSIAVFAFSYELYKRDFYQHSWVSVSADEKINLPIANGVPVIIGVGVSTCNDPSECGELLEQILISEREENRAPVTFNGTISNNLDIGKIEKKGSTYVAQTSEASIPEWVAFQDWVIKMALGNKHTCALINTGFVKCWGNNEYGQLGYGDTATRGIKGTQPYMFPNIDLGDGISIVDIVSMKDHTCALSTEGVVKCWGENEYGQLGYGNVERIGDNSNEMGNNLPPVDLGSSRKATGISTGLKHTCALLDNQTVKCWGSNEYGQLGQGDTNNRGNEPNEMGEALLAINLGALVIPTKVNAGEDYTCVENSSGTMQCVGQNNGKLIILNSDSSVGTTLSELGDFLGFAQIGTGKTIVEHDLRNANCVIDSSNELRCWGPNHYYILGQGLPDDGTVQLGTGQNDANISPIQIGTSRYPIKVTVGSDHVCTLLDNSTIKCWGNNGSGQLGMGDTSNRGSDINQMGDNLPISDLGTQSIPVVIEAGTNHNCVIMLNGDVKCWGMNDYGQLGNANQYNIGDGPNEMGNNLPAINIVD